MPASTRPALDFTPEQLRFPPAAGFTIRADFTGGEVSSDLGALVLLCLVLWLAGQKDRYAARRLLTRNEEEFFGRLVKALPAQSERCLGDPVSMRFSRGLPGREIRCS